MVVGQLDGSRAVEWWELGVWDMGWKQGKQ